MKKKLPLIIVTLLTFSRLVGQVEPGAGKWKTWFINSGAEFLLPPPPKGEASIVLSQQKSLTEATRQQIIYWNAGAPGYRWQQMMNTIWVVDTGRYGALANMLLGTAIYDATVAAWETKYRYKRLRPFQLDKRIQLLVPDPRSPGYPCEYSVAAGVASTILAHFYPSMADSVRQLAKEAMATRIAAGVAFPGDTEAGFELGKRIATIEIDRTKDFVNTESWDGKIPAGPGFWKGKKPMLPMAGKNKTVVLASGSEFRPVPPPDFKPEMEELKNYKQNFRSLANAFYWANEYPFAEMLSIKLFEDNLHLNPPRTARIYAALNVASYDGFVACWDAKYAYWGIRPNQYDSTFKPAIFYTPPFPGYPSGHASLTHVMAEILSYFFPSNQAYYRAKAKSAAESRFQAGIHFRSDNDAGADLGKKVAAKIIQKLRSDGIEKNP